MIPYDRINELIQHSDQLTALQKRAIADALQSRRGVIIRPTKKQSGGFLGALLASIGIPLLVKALTGKGQTGGFMVPNDMIGHLIQNKDFLTALQKRVVAEALHSGRGVVIKPTPKQSGGFLGTLLASIGIPLLVKALTGSGLHVEKSRPRRSTPVYVPPSSVKGGKHMPYPYQPPPFIGSWEKPMIGLGTKSKNSKRGSGLLLGKNSPFNNIPILGAIF